ncbi:MAG: flagellar biosynthesis protein FliS [Acidocella sp. 20-63-7]|nr:MAG: flagellar biosynthesis protein FliS [Acidocella sp. 20-63-7]
MDTINGYRAGMFDGEADVAWLRQGWRGLRFYGKRAQAALAAGDHATKAEMILRADKLLDILTGILDTESEASLGPALMTIYTALRYNLFRANAENNPAALEDFETALAILDRDMIKASESAIAA